MPSSGLISNCSQTGTLPYVIIDGRKVHRSLLPNGGAAPIVAGPNDLAILAAVNRNDDDGLLAAAQLAAHQAPPQVYSGAALRNLCLQYGTLPEAHELVRAHVFQHSAMATTIDLRDNAVRSPDGATFYSGLIFDDAQAALAARHIRLTVWTEIIGNYQRAFYALNALVRMCPMLETIDIDFTTETRLAVAREIQVELREGRGWLEGRPVALSSTATFVEADQ